MKVAVVGVGLIGGSIGLAASQIGIGRWVGSGAIPIPSS